MTTENNENIEEMSTVSGGAVEAAPADAEKEKEEKLRAIIREAIRLYSGNRKMLTKDQLDEQKVRTAIRKILLSEKESKDPAPTTTLEGVMRSLLNNIVPQIRLDYMKLQTNDDERQGFKDYFYNAVAQTIDITHDQKNSDQTELEEQDKIVLRSDDPDFINGVSDGTEDEQPAGEKEKADTEANISSYFERGQNFGQSAFNSIKDRIENAVYSQIVPDEYDEFVKVLNANLQAWFKIWDENRTKEDTDSMSPEDIDTGLDMTDLDTADEMEDSLAEDFEINLE